MSVKYFGCRIEVNAEDSYEKTMDNIINGCRLMMDSNRPRLSDLQFIITDEPHLTDGPSKVSVGMKWLDFVQQTVEDSKAVETFRTFDEWRIMRMYHDYLDHARIDEDIHDPQAWALFQVWRKIDEEHRAKEKQKVDDDGN